AIVGAALPMVFAIVTSRRKATQKRRAAQAQAAAQAKIAELQKVAQKYESVKAKLQASMVVVDYEQPVLLLGPRAVGKSSRMMQWHAPWNRDPLRATDQPNEALVPVF